MKIIRNTIVYIVLCILIGISILGIILYKNKDNRFTMVDKSYTAKLNIVVNSDIKSYIEEYVHEFNKIYPNIEIKIVCNSDNKIKKNINDIVKNKVSTIIVPSTKCVQDILKNNGEKIEDITEFMGNHKDEFLKSHIDNVSLQGKIYGMPLSEKPYFMIYRKDIFSKAKINIDDIKTWEDYINNCNLLNKKLKSNYKFMHQYKNANLYEMFLNQLGEGYVDINSLIKSDESSKSVQLIQELYKNKFIYLTEDNKKISEEIINGKLVSTICSCEDLIDIIQSNTSLNEKFDIKKIPSFEIGGNRDLSNNGSSILVINNRFSKVGNTFINFILDDARTAVELYLKQGIITANKGVYSAKILENKTKSFNNESIYSIINNVIIKSPDIKYDDSYSNIYNLIDKNLKNNSFIDFTTNMIKQFP